jgi:N-acyl-L-homoserine lactone synthetase
MDADSIFHARSIDGDARLLDESYRLRYQVYCVERGFLDSTRYPDGREIDEFDEHSLHLGVIDSAGEMVGTARLIKRNPLGFPMFRYCAFFPGVQMLDAPHVIPVEVSRLAISRHSARGHRRTEPFLTLVKAMVQGARLAGATHLMGANEASLHRKLAHFGFPYRLCGPTANYYGPVAPHVMSLHELDEVIGGGEFPALMGLESAGLRELVTC